MQNKSNIVMLVAAELGFLDTAYLTAMHFLGELPRCIATKSCDVVLTSSYSVWYGIPTAAFGLAFYTAVIILLTLYLSNPRIVLMRGVGLLASLAVAMSGYLVYVQAHILKAFCLYCLTSAGLTTVIFVLSMLCLTRGTTSAIINTDGRTN